MTPDSAYVQEAYQPYIQNTSPQYIQRQGALYPVYKPYEAPVVQEDPTILGELRKGFVSGIDQTQGALYGAVGLAGDAAGIDAVRDWGFENYQRNMDEAAENAAAVGSFTDIRNPTDAMLWAANTIGSLLPDAAAAVASGGLAGAGVAAARGLGKKAIGTAVSNRAKALIAEGLTAEVASKRAAQEIAKKVTSSYSAGAVLGSIPMEAGTQWGQDATQFGIENTNPLRDLAFGTASASMEAFSGVGQVLRTLTGKAISKTAEQAVQSSLKRHLATSAFREGGTESVQELTSMLNYSLREDGVALTEEDAYKLVDAFAAGALGGVAFGGVDRMLQKKPQETPSQPLVTDTSLTQDINKARGLPSITDISNDWYTGEEARVAFVMQELQDAEDKYSSEVRSLDDQMRVEQNFLANPEVSAEEKSNAQKNIAALAAQKAKAKENFDDIRDQTTRVVDSAKIAANKERLKTATKQKEIDKLERERSPEFTAYLYDYRKAVKDHVNKHLGEISRARGVLQAHYDSYMDIYNTEGTAPNQREFALEKMSDLNKQIEKLNSTEESLIKAKDSAVKLIANAREGSQSELVSAFNRIVSAGAKHNATYAGLSNNRMTSVDVQANIIKEMVDLAMSEPSVDLPSSRHSTSTMYMGPVSKPKDGRVTADLQRAVTQDQQRSALEQQVLESLAYSPEQAAQFDEEFEAGLISRSGALREAQARQQGDIANRLQQVKNNLALTPEQAAAFDREMNMIGVARRGSAYAPVKAARTQQAIQAQQDAAFDAEFEALAARRRSRQAADVRARGAAAYDSQRRAVAEAAAAQQARAQLEQQVLGNLAGTPEQAAAFDTEMAAAMTRRRADSYAQWRAVQKANIDQQIADARGAAAFDAEFEALSQQRRAQQAADVAARSAAAYEVQRRAVSERAAKQQEQALLAQQVQNNLAFTPEQAAQFDAEMQSAMSGRRADVYAQRRAAQNVGINQQIAQEQQARQAAATFDSEFAALGQQRQAQQAADVEARRLQAQQAGWDAANAARDAQRNQSRVNQQASFLSPQGYELPAQGITPLDGTIPSEVSRKPSSDIDAWAAEIDASRKEKKDEDAAAQPKTQKAAAKKRKKPVAKKVQAASADQAIAAGQQAEQTTPDTAEGDVRYAMPASGTSKSNIDSVTKWSNKLIDKLPVLSDKVTVVQTATDISPDINTNVPAVFIDGQVVLIADNVRNQDDITRLMAHEGITHYGLRAILSPQEFDALLDAVYNQFSNTPEWEKYINANPVYSQQGREGQERNRIQAEEFIAHIAEKKAQNLLLPTSPLVKLYHRVAAMVRKALHSLGLRNISEADVVDVLRASTAYLADESNLGAKLSKNDGLRYALNTPDVVEETYLDRQREKDALALDSVDKIWGKMNEFIRSGSVTTDKGVPQMGTMRRWLEHLADSNIRLKDIQKYIKATKGFISEKANAYAKMELMSNKAQDAMRKVLDTFIDPNNTGTVMYYVKALAKNPMFKNSDEAFAAANDYVLAVHAIERNANIKSRLRGGQKFNQETDSFSGMSTKKATEVVKMYENVPYMKDILESVRLLNKAHLEVLRKYNLESPTKLAKWEAAYKHYVPLQEWDQTLGRIDPDGFVVKNRAGLGIGNWKAAFAATGRNDLPAMPIVASLMQIDEAIRIGEKTVVGRSFLELVNEFPDQDLWEVVPENSKKYARRIMPDGTIAFYKQGHKFTGTGIPTIVILDESGKPVRVAIHDAHLARALRNENLLVTGPVVRGIGVLTRMMARMSTTLSLPFIISNPIRDIQTAVLNLGSVIEEYAVENNGTNISSVRKQLVRDVIPAAKAIYRYNKGLPPRTPEEKQWHSLVHMYKSSGAETTMYSMRDYHDTYKKLRNWSREPSAPVGMVMKVGEYLQDTSDMLENVTRLSVFKNMRDVYSKTKNQDGSQKYSPEEATTKAAGAALNLTVNFTKKGAWAPVLNALYMFSGANIAGNMRMMANLVRETSTRKENVLRMAKYVGGTMLGCVALGAMCRASMGEDEDGINKYDKIPDYIKSSNIIIPSPFSDGGYFKIPIPLGYHIFWGAGVQMDKLFNNRTTPAKAAVSTLGAAFDNFSVVGSAGEGWSALIPTVFRPVFQIATNTNFAGQPIMPTRDTSTPDSQKYWGTTSVWLKKLAQGLNEVTGGTQTKAGMIDVSPETIEHIVLAYTSGVGRLLWSSTQAMQTALTPEKESKFTDIPILNKFIGEVGFEDTQRLYSEIRQEVEADTQLIKLLQKQGVRGEEYQNARKAAKHALRVEGSLKAAESQLKKLRELESRMYIQYGEFHPEYNRRLKQVKEQRNRYMQQVMRVYERTKE